MKKQDLAVAAYLVAAFVMMIIPIPSWLLDILLACNIALGFTILFTAMFAKEVLDMSFFPTILLFTTIFRIALNISSTRLILTTGDPGEVVQTFGNYVGGGDLIVGAIVFLILIIVQFMIINKGSERVAEVTARFTLDAMPGKQMAIDADLNTGAINEILGWFGLQGRDWMASGAVGRVFITLINSWQYCGICMVIYMAGLQNISRMYYEAAAIDGAGTFQIFRSITLPLLIPAMSSAFVINLIGGLKLYDVVVSLSGGGPGFETSSLSWYIDNRYFKAEQAGYASAVGVVMFLFILLCSLILNGYFRKKEVEM